jgi:hypothetical protein
MGPDGQPAAGNRESGDCEVTSDQSVVQWIDEEFAPKWKAVVVMAHSDAYFMLLE